MNNDGKGKRPEKISKKAQLLLTFHKTTPFLHIFSQEDIYNFQSILHLFVFNRSAVLAKQNEHIDYLGIIVEGRSICKGKYLDIGDMIGWEAIAAGGEKHAQNVAAETDGVVLAIRLEDLLALEKSKYNKVISKCAQLLHMKEKDSLDKLKLQWEELQQKKASKYIPADWSMIFNQMDVKQKNRLLSYFPFYAAKQKTLILTPTCKPALIVLFSGQLTLKSPSITSQTIVYSPAIYNTSAFLCGTSCPHNVYCMTSQCVFWIVEKERFEMVGGKDTVRRIYEKIGQFKEEGESVEVKQEIKEWSLFKKYPDAQIVPLNLNKKDKPQLKPKPSKETVSSSPSPASLSTYQTLFREQLGVSSSNTKQVTKSSMAHSNYGKLYTLKTQQAQNEDTSPLQLQKLRKQRQNALDRLKTLQTANKQLKLQLIQTKCRVSMGNVHREILRLSANNSDKQGIIRINYQATNEKSQESSGHLVSLKQAFENQFKSNRVQVLVAKFAFRWLNTVRKRKAERKE